MRHLVIPTWLGSAIIALATWSAGCENPPPPYGAHLEGDLCVGDLRGCPATFDLVPCSATPGQVGRCNGDRFLYTFSEDRPRQIPGIDPGWMCFYEVTSKALVGQKVCLPDPVCGTHYCVVTPGTPNCDQFLTTIEPPACADAGAR